MSPWEKPTPHHKWADELAEDKRVKDAKRDAKKDAKAEDHTKECPFCHHSPVEALPQHPGLAPDHPEQRPANCYVCPECKRIYAANCPGTILLKGDTTMVEYGGPSNKGERLWNNQV